MTLMDVLDVMQRYLAEQLRDYIVYDKDMHGYPVNVYAGALPRKTSDTSGNTYYPAVFPVILGGNDEYTGSSLNMRIVIIIHDDSVGDGCREFYNLVERVRQILLQSTIMDGQVTVNMPLKWSNNIDTNWPLWQGWVDFSVDIAQDLAPLEKWYKKRR